MADVVPPDRWRHASEAPDHGVDVLLYSVEHDQCYMAYWDESECRYQVKGSSLVFSLMSACLWRHLPNVPVVGLRWRSVSDDAGTVYCGDLVLANNEDLA